MTTDREINSDENGVGGPKIAKNLMIEENAVLPKDKYKLVYITLFVLGVMRILPWGFFLTANDYWMYKFRNATFDYYDSDVRTDMQATFFSALSITLNVSDEAFLVISYLFGSKLRINMRLIGPLWVIFALFVLTAAFIYVDTDSWQEGFYGLSLAIAAAMNSANCVFGMAMYSFLSTIPHGYLAPYITGQGVSSIITSSLQLISMSVGISSQASAAVYFGLGIFINALSITLLVLTTRSPMYQHCIANSTVDQKKKKIFDYKAVKSVLWKMWPTLALFGTYILTIQPIHTSITSLVVSEFEGLNSWGDLYFMPTATFLVPYFFEVLGRIVANIPKFQLSPKLAVFCGTLRIFIFVPLIMLCNAWPRENFPVIFDHDYQYMIIMIFLTFSTGYVLAMCTLTMPKLVPREELETGFHVYNVGSSTLNSAFSPLGLLFVKLL